MDRDVRELELNSRKKYERSYLINYSKGGFMELTLNTKLLEEYLVPFLILDEDDMVLTSGIGSDEEKEDGRKACFGTLYEMERDSII